MQTVARLIVASTLLAAHAAGAQPYPKTSFEEEPQSGTATKQPWGGGVRLTGLSGIGSLPGVSFGAEVAVLVRRVEYFAELALGRWKPEDRHLVAQPQATTPLELAFNVWTLRGGWASMQMPLRGWLLVDVGEVAGARGMPGVIGRMVTGDTPPGRRWTAVGAGFGVAWPMSDQARLIGSVEFAIPVVRERLMLEQGEFEPDPISARYSLGLEVGWR